MIPFGARQSWRIYPSSYPRGHSLLGHAMMFAAYHQTCQPTISSSTVSTCRRADALPATGSVHLVGHGRPGYNRWKRITGAQSTRCGHRRRIARCGGRYDRRWSSAAVSEWVSLETAILRGWLSTWLQVLVGSQHYTRQVLINSILHFWRSLGNLWKKRGIYMDMVKMVKWTY